MKRQPVIDPANQCSHCPHEVIALPRSGTLWCPCEDCHPGGLIQGREPKVAARTLRERITEPTSLGDGITAYAEAFAHPDRLDTTPTTDDPADGEVWIDPVHRVG